MLLDILADFKNYFIAGGSILAAIPTYIKFIKPKITAITEFFSTINNNLEKLTKISETLGPNGGKSLYDAVKSIDLRLLVSENYLTMLFSHLKIGILRFNSEGKCIYVSPELSRIVGRPESDFIDNNYIQVIQNYNEINEELSNILEYRRMGTLKINIIKERDIVPMLMYIHPLNNSNKLEFIATVSEI